MSRWLTLLAFALINTGCNAMSIPCLAKKERPDLTGRWRFVGRPPGFDPELSDRWRPHPETMDLLPDGHFHIRYAGKQLDRLRELNPDVGDNDTWSGQWQVGWFCPGDLFLPTQWLRLSPGPIVRHFELKDDHLTIFYPFGSGCCHETYMLEAGAAQIHRSADVDQPEAGIK